MVTAETMLSGLYGVMERMPQDFPELYERYLKRWHPEDYERYQAIKAQEAKQTTPKPTARKLSGDKSQEGNR